MTDDKPCENCRYYVKHYHKDKYGRFLRLWGVGHCINTGLSFSASKKAIKKGVCEFFQPEEVQQCDCKKLILDKLHGAELLISDARRILSED